MSLAEFGRLVEHLAATSGKGADTPFLFSEAIETPTTAISTKKDGVATSGKLSLESTNSKGKRTKLLNESEARLTPF
jgi:hypothetical protein